MENLFKNDPPAQRKTKAPPERLTADADDEFTLIERRTKRYNDLAQRHQEATTSKKPTLISRLQTTTRSTSPTGDQPLGRAQKKLAENSNRNRLQSDAETKINSNNDVFAFDDGGLVHGSFVETPRRSTRATKTTSQYFSVDEAKSNNAIVPVEERYSVKHGLGPAWENPIVFPQTGKDRATVYFDDLPRLDDGEFLNDNLIEFYLRWSRQNAMDAGKLKDGQVHFFNTFFYERLTSGTRGISHAAVQRWTAKVDIFNHDYIVVPVNESAHWYLAIICNLRYLHRKLDLDEPEVVETSNPKIPHIDLGNAPAEDLTAQLMTAATSDGVPDEAPSSSKGIEDQPIAFKRPTGLEIHAVEKDGQLPEARNLQRTDGASPRQESQADEEWPASSETQPQAPISPFKCKTETQESNISAEQADLVGSQGLFKNAQPQSPAAKKGNRRKSGPPPRKYDPNSPMIIILDSLGLAHSKTVRHLKEYVVEEGKSKRSMSSSIDDIKGMNAKGIPQQQNFCDCGLFLLGYIEKFLQDPTNFVTKILSQEFNEFADWPEMNPQKMRDSMRDLLMETYKQQEENRPRKKKKSPKKKATPTKEREVPPTTEERSMFLQKGIQAQMREQDAENRTESKPGDIEDVEPVAARERGSFFGRNGRNPKRSPQAEQQAQLPIALQEAPSILSQPVQDRTLEPVKAANSSNRGTPDVIMANSQPEDEVMLLPTGDVNEMLHEREAKEPEITRLAPRSLPAPKSLRKRTREESIEIPESQEADASMAKSPKRAKESTSSPASRSDGLPFDFPTQFPSLNRLAGSSPSRESRGQQGKTNP